ncbi:DUF2142 domain-containing protein [Streptococcaceae bacterium ESL0687]|nr:DUF2142 domain-containing protein [Streptococcaceae bacterium ESL0687]
MEKIRKNFLILVLTMGTLAVFLMPAGLPPDEGHHFYVINKILNKNWVWIENGSPRKEGAWPSTDEVRRQVGDHTYYQMYFKERVPASEVKYNFNFHLKDIVYLPQIIGICLARVICPTYGMMFILGRLFNLLAYAIGIYFCLKYATYGKRVMFYVALFPVMIQQAGSLSYDVFTILAIFNFFTLLTRLSIQRKSITKKEIGWLICSALLLYVTKKNNILLLALLPFLPTQLLRSKKLGEFINKIFDFVNRRKLSCCLGAFIGGLAVFYFYLRTKGGLALFVQVMYNSLFRADINPTLNGILDNGIIGYFSDFAYQLPSWMIVFDFMLLALLLFTERSEDTLVEKRFGIASGFVYPLQMVAIVAGMYFEWTSVVAPGSLYSQGAQGRYFTPFIIFFVPFAMYLSKHIKVKVKDGFLNQVVLYSAAINLFTFILLIIQYEWMPNRGIDFLTHLL